MHRFYLGNGRIEETRATLIGGDVNHIKNVLRMKSGDRFELCTTDGMEYLCQISELNASEITAEILEQKQAYSELPVSIVLFQGIPKREKMEFIIQKTVELGVSEIIPVMTKRVVVRIEDAKREKKKLERWQAIAESAAKQSGRAKIPKIGTVMDWNEALNYAKQLKTAMIPYELARQTGMQSVKAWVQKACSMQSAGIFIGPEGGFEAEEVETANAAGIVPVSLGKRILRTETAAITALSILMYETECQLEE